MHVLGAEQSGELDTKRHLGQRRGVVARDEVRPEEQLGGQETLVLDAAGLLGATFGVPEAVAPRVILRLGVVLAKLLRLALVFEL